MVHLNFSSIFSGPENIFWFVLGVISVQVWQVIKAKWKDLRHPEGRPHPFKRVNWLYVMIALTWMLSIFIGVDNQRTYTFAEQLSRDTRACQVEFNKALIANRDLNQQDRELMVQWARVSYNRATQLSYLAQTYGPASEDYLRQRAKVDSEYSQEIQNIEHQRIKNDEVRALTPYPEPTCGKDK